MFNFLKKKELREIELLRGSIDAINKLSTKEKADLETLALQEKESLENQIVVLKKAAKVKADKLKTKHKWEKEELTRMFEESIEIVKNEKDNLKSDIIKAVNKQWPTIAKWELVEIINNI